MNGWKMLHSKHGRVLPQIKGMERGREKWRWREVGRQQEWKGGGRKEGAEEGLRAFSGYRETEGGTERRS